MGEDSITDQALCLREMVMKDEHYRRSMEDVSRQEEKKSRSRMSSVAVHQSHDSGCQETSRCVTIERATCPDDNPVCLICYSWFTCLWRLQT
ncbi:hypothetical protein RRG08_027037 [Elysia crispata]|uniref:Uncharacterized protein n=1 Tax=Elysia crispata TaxID=231223 RepID=A0AAE0ZJ99_9GAST|nr:hypothetical protein RRG08_027037 [Elysia crispata]